MIKYETQFNATPPSIEEGVIVGATRSQEWLLPWWWMHFRLHNTCPVTFFDFGDLSSKALEWCRRRGQVKTLIQPDFYLATKESVDPIKASDWESMCPKVWELRITWFKKIFAMLATSYNKTIWIDLDCQVAGSLKPLFALDLHEGGIGCVPENADFQRHNLRKGRILEGQIMYNSGVIVYDYRSKIIEDWAKGALELNHLFNSEQQLLAHILFTEKLPFVSLPDTYNWTIDQGMNQNAIIIHFWGARGKESIKKQIQEMNTKMGFNITLNDKMSLVGEATVVQF